MNTTIPELSDEQIESMRFAIMTDVNKSTRAKARRYRQALVGVAAVVAFAGIGATVVGSDIGTQSSDKASSDSAGNAKSEPFSPNRAGSDSSGAQGASPEADGALADGREIVTTGSLGMQVTHPVDAASKISAVVSSAGGRVDSRSETAANGDDAGSVQLVVRIPQAKVEGAIEKFRTYGTVENVNIADTDVTAQGKDLDARIKALRISVDRLEGLMKNATTTNELLRAENALTARQAELDSLVSQRKSLSDRVELSSLQIDLSATPMANSVSPSGFWGGVVTGWNGLVATIDGAVHVLGVILPWGLALSELAGLGWLVTRRRSSRVA